VIRNDGSNVTMRKRTGCGLAGGFSWPACGPAFRLSQFFLILLSWLDQRGIGLNGRSIEGDPVMSIFRRRPIGTDANEIAMHVAKHSGGSRITAIGTVIALVFSAYSLWETSLKQAKPRSLRDRRGHLHPRRRY
jgi:hypothetical protein